MPSPVAIARVLVDSPLPQLDRLFDYAVPEALRAEARPGVRVRVPIRSVGRIADGLIVELTDHAGFEGALSDIDAVVSTVPVLAPEVWALARTVADRAAGAASDVIRLAVPRRQVRVEKSWVAQEEAGPADLPAPLGAFVPADDLFLAPGRMATAIAGAERCAVDAVARPAELLTGPHAGEWVGQWAVTMAAGASHAIAAGGSAILCVPDYRDQEQLAAALLAVLPADRIVRLDARQSNPERYRSFLACLTGEPLVIVGNRSVIYAPAKNLALVALWDDGDPLHAEPLAPYVHSRDAALVRQQQQGGALWFVSHARSTEVERLLELGFLVPLSPERSYSPRVIPTLSQGDSDGPAAAARIPSTAWREAKTALAQGPVLVQVARPGFAPRLACTGCAESARCRACDGPLGTRTSRSVPACQWCGALAADWSCPTCEATTYRLVGQGSARTAVELGRAFPGIRVIIADGDHPVLRVDAQPALVIATRGAEPIADGGYRAVLLLDGEQMLARESLRVGEDCLRWWANAAALAAPGAPVMLAGVGGPIASALATWRPGAYAASELHDRRRLRFPPAVRVATVTGTAAAVERAILGIDGVPGVDVLGPVEVEQGSVRAIVRFEYAQGHTVASALRAEVITAATTRRKRIAGAPAARALPTLRVRLDDLEPFQA